MPKINFKELTVTAPSWFASYLVNGDASGLDEKDIEQADKLYVWCRDEEFNGAVSFVDCGEPRFARYSDASQFGALAGDVCDYSVLVYRCK